MATPITCGLTSGSTIGAQTTFPAPSDCGAGPYTSPDVWYFINHVGDLRLKTCGAEWDTKISVFSGSCGALTCLGAQDDAGLPECRYQNNLVVTATGPTYIMVHGHDGGVGDFDLEVICGVVSSPSGSV